MYKFLTLVFAFLIFSNEVYGAPKHYLMGAIGDSISVAFMADTSAKAASLSSLLTKTSEDQVRATIDKESKLDNRWTLSWTSGNQIQSHFVFLTNYFKKTEPTSTLEVLNVAVSGAVTEDLLDQANQIVAATIETNKDGTKKYDSLKYLTFLIGANDACHGIADEDMKANLNHVFSILNRIKQSEPVRILVSGLPKIPDLGLSAINNSTGFGGFKCSTIRNITGTCRALVSWTDNDDYNNKVTYVSDRNRILKSAVDAANLKYLNLKIAFNDEIFQQKIVAEELAAECFHPNAIGQETLSKSLWTAQPWYQ